jgi:hypothetical protein
VNKIKAPGRGQPKLGVVLMMLEEQAHWGFCARCHRHRELDHDQLCVWCYDRKVEIEQNRHQHNHGHVWKVRERKKKEARECLK